MKKLVGTKLKMTQIFKDGRALGVTPIQFEGKTDFTGLEEGMSLKVSGVSKGHGFSGVVKKWNFRGGPRTHGNKHHERAPGSIGSTDMARVVKGRKMAGRYGMERVSYRNIEIVGIDAENKILMIHGSAPGIIGRRIEIVAPIEEEARSKEEGVNKDESKKEEIKAEEKVEKQENRKSDS